MCPWTCLCLDAFLTFLNELYCSFDFEFKLEKKKKKEKVFRNPVEISITENVDNFFSISVLITETYYIDSDRREVSQSTG